MLLTDELKKKYINDATKKIEARVDGFSVNEREISEAAYYNACKKWEADGYYELPTEYTTKQGWHEREKNLLML